MGDSQKKRFALSPATGLPSGLVCDLRILADDMAEEHCWSLKEKQAAKLLFESRELVPLWRHLGSLIESHCWYKLATEVFIKAYAEQSKPFREHWEADDNTSLYAAVAQKAWELNELLSQLPSEHEPGFISDADALINRTDLPKQLLELTSMTTSCRLPAIRFEYVYGPDNQRPNVDDDQNCLRAETCRVFRKSKAKDQDPPSPYTPYRKGYRYLGDVFRPNPAFIEWLETAPPGEYWCAEDRDILLSKNAPEPPLFAPIQSPEFDTTGLGAYTEEISYLRLVIRYLDNFSDDLGRPERCKQRTKPSGHGLASPLYLTPDLGMLLLEVLFSGGSKRNPRAWREQVARELRRPPR